MSGTQSCKQCGCSEIDTDPARGDAVCTNCGCVLEESIIVSEVTFEEDGHGGASAIGQFVSAESRGGGILSAAGGGGFHTSVGKESREITLRNTKKKIIEVAQQLRLNQHCIDVSFNFFKMALHKQLTKGRKHGLTIAACIYMTCRIEGTPHLLIDFSDVLQMDVYALGRAYCQISRALYINIPAVDPCMYILRFAHKFDLAEKTHDVAMTALRMVQRMKRDWIHLGRRPSGLCGAALLISARLHNFSRSVQDVIRVVKVHETTLRKRLVEFGETPSSSLTLDEFMSVDLEEEHDPPSYKAARIRDRERLQKLLDSDVSQEFKDLQTKIEEGLDKRRIKMMNKSSSSVGSSSSSSIISPASAALSLPPSVAEEAAAVASIAIAGSTTPTREREDESHFILESTLDTINCIIATPPPDSISTTGHHHHHDKESRGDDVDRMLMPPPGPVTALPPTNLEVGSTSMSLVPFVGQGPCQTTTSQGMVAEGELDLDGIDDSEINGYIMTSVEVERKTVMWEDLNKDYIEAQRLKQEQLERDILEGKVDKKKKKKNAKAKPTFQAKSANEAIKIMLKERKISSKINYDVLRSLTAGVDFTDETAAFSNNNPAQSSQHQPFDPNFTTTKVIESGPIISASNKRKLLEAPTDSSDTASNTSNASSGTSSKKKSKSSRRKSRSTSIEEVEGGETTTTVGRLDAKTEKKEKDASEDTKPERKPKIEKIKVGNKEDTTTSTELGDEEKEKIKLKEAKKEKKQMELLENLKKRVYGVNNTTDPPQVEEGAAVVVESGQVIPFTPAAEEEEDLDDEEEEDEASLSARDLLTQFRGEADNEDEDYYE